MKKLSALLTVCAFSLTLTASIAYATIGQPISGVPVGLEHSPPDDIVARAVTNGEGNVTFTNLKPGRYSFVLMETSRLKVPCRMFVTYGKETLPLSEPILPGKPRATAYALDKGGHKLVAVYVESGGSITVHVSSAEVTTGTPKRQERPWSEKIPRP